VTTSLADHRDRLMAATAEALFTDGYAGTTVSRVVQLAGVSRATFYEHFADRDECFRVAYRERISSLQAASASALAGKPKRSWPEALIDAVLREFACDPATARLVLLEALAAPNPVRREHDDLIRRIEEQISCYLDAQTDQAAIQMPAIALLSGVGELLATRALAGGKDDPRHLQAELTRWLDAYRLADGARPLPQARWAELGRFSKELRSEPEGPPALLPRGRSALSPLEGAALRRRRILDATVRLAAEEGYPALTVAKIAQSARVPKSAFYSLFDGKEDALLAAQTEGMQGAMAAAAAEYSVRGSWPTRVWRAAVAFLTYVAENPGHARLDFIESYSAGQAVTKHRQQNRMAFALFLEEGYLQSSRGSRLSRFCSEAIAAAVFGLMRKLVIEGKTQQMLCAVPAMVYTVLAPFLGPERAADQVQEWARAAP